MKNQLIIGALLILVIAFGFLYRMLSLPEPVRPIDFGPVVDVVIRIPYHTWSFDPDQIDLPLGTRIRLLIMNDDDQEHGFAIDQFGIQVRVPADGQVATPVLAPVREGEYLYYCSWNCGEGIVESGPESGKTRGRFDMQGVLTITSPGNIPSTSVPRAPH